MYNSLIIIISVVLSIAAICGFGWICYKQGEFQGRKEGIEIGRVEILEENIVRADKGWQEWHKAV